MSRRTPARSGAPSGEAPENPTLAPRRAGVKRLWPVILGGTALLLAGALALLWPVFVAAGVGVGAFMIAALLVLTLGPVLMLRKVLRRTHGGSHDTPAERKG